MDSNYCQNLGLILLHDSRNYFSTLCGLGCQLAYLSCSSVLTVSIPSKRDSILFLCFRYSHIAEFQEMDSKIFLTARCITLCLDWNVKEQKSTPRHVYSFISCGPVIHLTSSSALFLPRSNISTACNIKCSPPPHILSVHHCWNNYEFRR